MEQKLQKLYKLVQQARSKIETIQENTLTLQKLNIKLEALLTVIENLKVPPVPKHNAKSLSPPKVVKTDDTNISITNLKDSDFFNGSFSKSIHIEQPSTLIDDKYTLDTIKQKIIQISTNKKFIENANKIVNVFHQAREGLSIDCVMRKSGVSKYRCIDIINELMKCTPQVLLKRYECKLYVYQLNI